jgi:membrane-associated PAP2 superfamily phosphatase
MRGVTMTRIERTAQDEHPARAPLRWVIIPALLALALLLVDAATDMDRSLTRLVFDRSAAAFPLRFNFWLDVVLHHWAKYAVATLGCVVLATFVLTFVLPGLTKQRQLLLFIVLALSLAPLSVTIGKAVSPRHCPWDVDEFGGLVPYTRLLEPNATNVEPGHCFPAGHASTGFALLAFYFAAYARRMRRTAPALLAIGIIAGLGLGFGRVLQGAHFASHVLWSGLLCWIVMVALYMLLLRPIYSAQTPRGKHVTDGTINNDIDHQGSQSLWCRFY